MAMKSTQKTNKPVAKKPQTKVNIDNKNIKKEIVKDKSTLLTDRPLRQVVFEDADVEHRIIMLSTAKAKHTIEIDGVTFPYIKVSISAKSHPFFLGKRLSGSKDSRATLFKNRYASVVMNMDNSNNN